jgi:hypothetical protein
MELQAQNVLFIKTAKSAHVKQWYNGFIRRCASVNLGTGSGSHVSPSSSFSPILPPSRSSHNSLILKMPHVPSTSSTDIQHRKLTPLVPSPILMSCKASFSLSILQSESQSPYPLGSHSQPQGQQQLKPSTTWLFTKSLLSNVLLAKQRCPFPCPFHSQSGTLLLVPCASSQTAWNILWCPNQELVTRPYDTQIKRLQHICTLWWVTHTPLCSFKIMSIADMWHKCLHTSKCFYLAHSWKHTVPLGTSWKGLWSSTHSSLHNISQEVFLCF